MNRVRNDEVHIITKIEMGLARGVDSRVIRWFAHVERMDECRMARRV